MKSTPIETHYVSQDYYGASAQIGEKHYFQFADTRQKAFSGILWQLAEALKIPV